MKSKPFSDQIRDAVDASGLTRYRVCKEAGINPAQMSRFMSGKGGLSLASLDRLADLLELRITKEPAGGKDG